MVDDKTNTRLQVYNRTLSQPEANLEWISRPNIQEVQKFLSEEIFLRSPIEELVHSRKQTNQGNSPMTALMLWLSMIALVNHTLSVALRYHRVHRRISSPTHHPRNAFYKNIWRIWISRQVAPRNVVKTVIRRSDYKQSDSNRPTALDCQFFNTTTIKPGFDLWVGCDSSLAVDQVPSTQ